jgi:hypothetical protein
MVDDLDIYRSATALVKQHGDTAAIALLRFDAVDGSRGWHRDASNSDCF